MIQAYLHDTDENSRDGDLLFARDIVPPGIDPPAAKHCFLMLLLGL